VAYLLDANVLITAKNNHYGFDFCRAFWDWLDTAHHAGVVFSIERVYDELVERDDDLSGWCRDRRPMFLALDADDVRAVATVNRWANDSPDYDPAAKAEFADVADSFLVAQALARGHTIVTHERISDGRRRIKIPNAAAAHVVEWCTPFHMLRVERARFVLGGVA
jgi:hypothetical protein